MAANSQRAPSVRERTGARTAPRFPIPPNSIAAFARSLVSETALEVLWDQRVSLRSIYDDGSMDEVLAVTEYAILVTAVPGPRAAELKLWLALAHHSGVSGDLNEAADRGELDPFRAAFELLDWDVKMLVAAIAALRGEVVHV